MGGGGVVGFGGRVVANGGGVVAHGPGGAGDSAEGVVTDGGSSTVAR
jgi:hypothetical protein